MVDTIYRQIILLIEAPV